MTEADTPRDIGPTGDLPQDIVISSASGAITLTIPACSGGGWKITYCRRDYSDDCIAGTYPYLEFRLPREDGSFDVFPFNSSERQFGEPYSIEPGLGRRFQDIVTGRRLLLAAALLATLVAGIGGVIVCNPGGNDADGNDTSSPVTDKAEPDGIG